MGLLMGPLFGTFPVSPVSISVPFRPMSSTSLRVFLLFSASYFVSYVFRGVNLGFAPLITHEMGLSATDLGLLTSLYFLGFAGAQIPAGVLLDHYGSPRPPPRPPPFAGGGASG